jgi:hypothetical protein
MTTMTSNRLSKGRTIVAASILVALSTAVQLSKAQSTSGDLVGSVADATGALIPGAKVEVVEESTGVRTTKQTEANGQYRFNNLHIGTYDLTVTATGFTTATLKGLAVELNKTATQNVTLSVGQVSQTTTVVVEAEQPIDTSTAQIQTNFNTKLAADLPTASFAAGGVLNLSLLGAGVANAGGVGMGGGPSVGGQRPNNNNFTIEGIDNNEKTTTGFLLFVPNDAVSEFTMLQNQFGAEFGHSSGGQFNTNIKSGTNQIHGAIYEYFGNRNLNAVDQAAANSGILSNPRFDQNRLGASVGGPIKKDKLFYYALFEYNPTGQASVPSSALHAPTVAGYSQIAAMPGVSKNNLSILQKYAPPAAAATGSISVGPPGSPAAQVPVGILPVAAPNYQNAYYGVASIDYNISDRDQLRGRFIYNKLDTIDTTGTLPAFFILQPNRLYMGTLSEFHNFSPNVTNELRLGYMRFNQNFPIPNLNFPGLDAFPNLLFQDLNLPIGPNQQAPQFTIQNTYQVTDNLTWTKGAHTFKFGFDGRKFISPQMFTQRSRGDYEYSNVSSYLFDLLPDQVAQRSLGNTTYYGDQIATYLYANDQWKMNPHLTLNLGVRWEFTSVPYSERLQPLNSISNVPGLITFNEPQPQYKNFAPRIGVAYSPGDSGKTSIRAGFGMNYDVIIDNIGILALPPQLSTTVDLLTFNPTNIQNNFLANGGIRPNTATGPLTQAEARAATAAYIPDQKLPYSIQWNIGIQHQFLNDYTFEARYLGTRGVHLDVQQRINEGSPVTVANSLPTFLSQPTAAQLAGLKRTLGNFPDDPQLPAFAAAGFGAGIVENAPIGNSVYHGLALQLNRRFSRGLQLIGAYTWSHNIDDSTADFFTTNLTPRRAQNFQDLRADRSSSALDRRHRLTLTAVYDVPFYKGSQNWFLKNLLGNWEVAPVYTYESPEWATVQSAIDSNLNGDPAPDRAIINPNGAGNTGTGVHAIDATGANLGDPQNADPSTVAYVANNPNAKYVVAGPGTYPDGGRNTLPLRPINNLDLSLIKRFAITERMRFEFQAQFSNALNHPQYTGGYLNHVDGANPNLVAILQSGSVRNLLTPGNEIFNRPDLAFSSNPRSIVLVGKFTF